MENSLISLIVKLVNDPTSITQEELEIIENDFSVYLTNLPT